MSLFRSQLARFQTQLDGIKGPKPAETVEKVRKIVANVMPDAELHLFGSTVTGMRIPKGDVDVMVESSRFEPIQALKALHNHLKNDNSYVSSMRLRDRGKSRVPSLRWIDKTTGILVDCCVNAPRSLRTTADLMRLSVNVPDLKPLVLLLKTNLWMHNLNEHGSGGIGGYQLASLLADYIRTESENADGASGILLGFMRKFSDEYNLGRALRSLEKSLQGEGGEERKKSVRALHGVPDDRCSDEGNESASPGSLRRRMLCSQLRLNCARLEEALARPLPPESTSSPLNVFLPQWSASLTPGGLRRCYSKWDDVRRIRWSQAGKTRRENRELRVEFGDEGGKKKEDPLWSLTGSTVEVVDS